MISYYLHGAYAAARRDDLLAEARAEARAEQARDARRHSTQGRAPRQRRTILHGLTERFAR